MKFIDEYRDRELAKKLVARIHHQSTKPIKLMEWIITLGCQPNGVVLDPFMGSGTTGIAAIKEGFSFIGIERELDYFKISKARIQHYLIDNKQLSLFKK